MAPNISDGKCFIALLQAVEDLGQAYVDRSIRELLRASKCDDVPVDLVRAANHQSVHRIELRPLVAGGLIAPVLDGFEIHINHDAIESLSATPSGGRNLSRRQRFSLAHEIVHTLFFDRERRPPVPVQNAPQGAALERLCQHGARLLLLPESLLIRELGNGGQVDSIQTLLRLSDRFGASVEVILRRIDEAPQLKRGDFCIVFFEQSASKRSGEILAACYDNSLHGFISRPKLYSELADWLGDFIHEGFWSAGTLAWTKRATGGELRFRKARHHRGGCFFLEMSFCPE